MPLVPATYVQAPSLQFQDLTISPDTLAAGTLRQRFDTLAFPQVGSTLAGTISTPLVDVPTAPRTTSGVGS